MSETGARSMLNPRAFICLPKVAPTFSAWLGSPVAPISAMLGNLVTLVVAESRSTTPPSWSVAMNRPYFELLCSWEMRLVICSVLVMSSAKKMTPPGWGGVLRLRLPALTMNIWPIFSSKVMPARICSARLGAGEGSGAAVCSGLLVSGLLVLRL